MSVISITTTAREAFSGSNNLDSINFKNGSASGTIYLRNKQVKRDTVTSSDYEWSLPSGAAVGFTRTNDGEGIVGPWSAISDTGGGVTLEVLPIYKPGTGNR
jgi:hypothetical protein